MLHRHNSRQNPAIPRRGFCVGDAVVLAALILLAALSALLIYTRGSGTDNLYLEIIGAARGEQIYPLSADREIEITSDSANAGTHHTLLITVKDGAARVTESDCRDRICVNTPAISAPGQAIVCAPAGIVIKITNGKGSGAHGADADYVAG